MIEKAKKRRIDVNLFEYLFPYIEIGMIKQNRSRNNLIEKAVEDFLVRYKYMPESARMTRGKGKRLDCQGGSENVLHVHANGSEAKK